MTEVDKQIGARIRERRRALGYSQAYVADVIGLTFQQVQKYETGATRVAAATLLRIAEVLRTEPAALLPQGRKPALEKAIAPKEALALELQQAFRAITSPRQRRLVLEMARTLGGGASKRPIKTKRRVSRKR